MLHEDPGRRAPADVALCSPFFSIPFGTLCMALFLSGLLELMYISKLPCLVFIHLFGELTSDNVLTNPTAPHIEDLVMLPTPVLRLLNVLDGDYLESEEGYEGQCYLTWLFTSFLTGLPGTSRPKILGASSSIQ